MLEGLIAILVFMMMVVVLQLLFQTVFRERLAMDQRLALIDKQEKQDQDHDIIELKRPLSDRLVKPVFDKLSGLVSRLTRQEVRRKLALRLTQAGHPLGLEAQDWMTWHWVLSIGPVIAGIVLGVTAGGTQRKLALLVMLLGPFAYLFVDLYLNGRISQRRQEIERTLPDVLDLLTVSVEAGLAFDAAMLKVVDKMPGVLASEFQRVAQEISVGRTRKDALREMASRAGTHDLNSFVSALVQAEQLGTSLGKVLRVQSKDLRQKRRQRAEEKAMKAPIKMLFPLIIFIFPTLFLVLLGPSMMRFLDAFK